MSLSHFTDREWRRNVSGLEYLVSTSLRHIDIVFVNESFESDDMYWAKRLPEDQIRTMLENSLNMGLYKVSPATAEGGKEQLQQIGLARFVTDYVTFAYLGDVFISKEERGNENGKWLIRCCQEMLEGMPGLRRALLLTSQDVGKRFYSRELGFWDMAEEQGHLCCMTRRTYTMGSN